MTIADLIAALQAQPDHTLDVRDAESGNVVTGVIEGSDCVYI